MKYNATQPMYQPTRRALHLDWPLLGLLLLLISAGLFILYSASNENTSMLLRQIIRLTLAFSIMLALSFIPPHTYKRWSPGLYALGLLLLFAVMGMGKIGKGAQRWLDLGFFRFQPSEIMKLAVPMMTAWYLDKKTLPLDFKSLCVAIGIIFIPTLIIAEQPDLGTAIMVASGGIFIIFLAGISMRTIGLFTISLATLAPVLWHVMHNYQKQRVMTLLNPERDPLGSGYHIIQSKIAIGSGGAFGKGWLSGSQSHLNFLPEHATDFIFSVGSEEFGFIGSAALILLFFFISLRCIYIAKNTQTNYTRLLAVGLSMSFFLSAFVNIGMVMGILPVVGVPLPLVSYGGTAMVTFLAGFGVLMSISSHRILFNTL
ncbi:MAG: rod shape-determining protein RodA [Gammaproteobacteria bacterium]|nr:rod shape-determining protein RodA [Gammaproteobacteria bacterium]